MSIFYEIEFAKYILPYREWVYKDIKPVIICEELLDDDIKVLNEKLYQEKQALLNDAAFKKYLNDVIYYQDSNYQIISGNELKKGLTKKKKS